MKDVGIKSYWENNLMPLIRKRFSTDQIGIREIEVTKRKSFLDSTKVIVKETQKYYIYPSHSEMKNAVTEFSLSLKPEYIKSIIEDSWYDHGEGGLGAQFSITIWYWED